MNQTIAQIKASLKTPTLNFLPSVDKTTKEPTGWYQTLRDAGSPLQETVCIHKDTLDAIKADPKKATLHLSTKTFHTKLGEPFMKYFISDLGDVMNELIAI